MNRFKAAEIFKHMRSPLFQMAGTAWYNHLLKYSKLKQNQFGNIQYFLPFKEL